MESGEADASDPGPDIHELFCHYNSLYFDDALGACVVSWSSRRMASRAGVCRYQKDGGCEIHLSEPLLKYRSTADLKNTLLHEMIHAFLWIIKKNRDHSDHGPSFLDMMNAINSSSMTDHQRPKCGYNITTYHDFHGEVDSYRVHHWLCELCEDLMKTPTDREPSASDCLAHVRHDGFCSDSSCQWHRHKMQCSGKYKKIGEPPGLRGKRRGSKGVHGLIEGKSMGSCKTRSQKAEADKPDIKRLKTIKNYFPSASYKDTGKDIKFEEWKSTDLTTESIAFTPEIPKRVRTPVSRKRRCDCIKEINSGECKEIAMYSAWLGFYEYAVTEDIPPLINKRTERRKMQKMLRDLRGRDLEDESLQDYEANNVGIVMPIDCSSYQSGR